MGFCVLILKVVAAGLLFLAFVLGVVGHVDSKWTKDWNDDSTKFKENCEKSAGASAEEIKSYKQSYKKDPDLFPTYVIPMELVFIIFTIILFIVSCVMIVMGLVQGQREIKGCDGAYSAIAGILIIVCGILMVIAAVRVDRYLRGGVSENEYIASLKKVGVSEDKTKEDIKKTREENKLFLKAFAGALALFDGIFYLVVCCVICACSD